MVMMLRNLSQQKLCNGKRVVIKKLMINVIHATILEEKFLNEEVLIQRIPMTATDMTF
jgi:PIF1 helicase.